ncbi:MAG: radical SAM protein [Candidatus Magasanikbacteria bacterium]|nr:radical SAM protein [Candidatus Magasanikbacteria bacterium]
MAKNSQTKRLEISISNNLEEMPCFCESSPLLLPILDYEDRFEIWLKNFPFCTQPSACHDHIVVDKFGEKSEICATCKYYKICSGFPLGYLGQFGESEVKPIIDKPIEAMFEIEPNCNFDCSFCFNKISFAENGRNIKKYSTDEARNIIKKIAEAKIEILRFTGGEPLLRKDIFELIKYANELGLKVWLNTNGSLVDFETVEKIKGLVENVLIPIESFDSQEEERITGFKNSLEKKLEAVKLLKQAGIKTARVGTVAIPENIKNFEKLSELVLSLPIDEWEFYYPVGGILEKEELESLVDQILEKRKKTDKEIIIANSIPFCEIDEPQKLNLICRGALFDDGHSRLVIDPRGFVKPHYFVNKNIGEPEDIMTAWNHEYMRALRNLEFLPEKCQECRFKFKCRGAWLIKN